MRTFETWLLTYLLNALWQVPLVFFAAWIAARATRHSGPTTEHRIWALALAFETLLPACSFSPYAWLHALISTFARKPALHSATVSVTMGAAEARGGLHAPPLLLHSIALIYAVVVLYFAARLIVSLRHTERLRRNARALHLSGDAHASFTRLAQIFSSRGVSAVFTAQVSSPLVLGVLRPLLLLPGNMLADVTASAMPGEDFDAALAHEFAHLQRSDYAKNLLYELLSLPIAFHPMRWYTRTRIAETRELICDTLAADAVHGRQRYARSLLRLAANFSERTRSTQLHAIGLFDANSSRNFERRIMNLTQRPVAVHSLRRITVTTLSVALGLGACTSALALRMRIASPGQQQQSEKAAPVILGVPHSDAGAPAKVLLVDISPSPSVSSSASPAPMRVRFMTPTTIPVDESITAAKVTTAADVRLPVAGNVIAGNIESKVAPVYPPEAKEKHISGAVVLAAVIGKEGNIADLKVVSGPEELTKSALDAVKQWKYKPYLLNGQPTEVETTITINYSLAGN